MASHSTREGKTPSSRLQSSAGEVQEANGPRRMALSERMDASESKGQTPAPGTEPCFVYVLRCGDALSGREKAHNEGHGSEYTSGRRPVRIVYSEAHRSWPAARKREVQIKRWSHAKKQALVDEHLDRLQRLARRRHS